MKVSLAFTTLLSKPDKYGETIVVLYKTHEKNSGDAVRRLGVMMQSTFCAISSKHSLNRLEMV